MKKLRSRGFTLLELLVVVFMIGVILSFAMLSVGPSQNRLLTEEAKRIFALMEVAKDEAILNSQELAFIVNDEGYGFQVFALDGWQALDGDTVLRDRVLPEQVRMDISILGEEIKLAKPKSTVSVDVDDEEKKDEDIVRIFFLSSGEITPFELFLHFDDEEDGLTIEGNELGELALKAHKVTL